VHPHVSRPRPRLCEAVSDFEPEVLLVVGRETPLCCRCASAMRGRAYRVCMHNPPSMRATTFRPRQLRDIASISIYVAAAFLAVLYPRPLQWMTVSDFLLLLAAFFLAPSLGRLRFVTAIQKGYILSVALIVVGGAVASLAASDSALGLSNVLKLCVSAGVMILVVAAWQPSSSELRRVLLLVMASGLTSGVWALSHSSAGSGRPDGLSGHPNHLALVALLSLGPALALAALGSSTRRRIIGVVVASTLLGAIVVSGSRSGLIGFAIECLLGLFLFRRSYSTKVVVIASVALLAVAVFASSALSPENAVTRLFHPSSQSASVSDVDRRSRLTEMINEIERHPVRGNGFADPLKGHNAYLQLWAAAGLLGFIGGVGVLASTGLALWRARIRDANADERSVGWPLAASSLGLAGALVAMGFQNLLWVRYVWFVVAVVAASSVAALGGALESRSRTTAASENVDVTPTSPSGPHG